MFAGESAKTRGRKVAVVLPAFNEQANLGPLLESIAAELAEEALPYETIVVDDGSTDATAEVARWYGLRMPLRLVRHPVNQGLGPTLRDGLKAALNCCDDNDVIVAMDADNSHLPGLVGTMVRAVREGNDVVIASRYQAGAQVRGVPLVRRMLSRGASWLFRLAFPIAGVKDYTCGYRAYRAGLLRRGFECYGDDLLSEPGFQCTVDLLLKLARLGAICREWSAVPGWTSNRRSLAGHTSPCRPLSRQARLKGTRQGDGRKRKRRPECRGSTRAECAVQADCRRRFPRVCLGRWQPGGKLGPVHPKGTHQRDTLPRTA